jgi:hypothetical protein
VDGNEEISEPIINSKNSSLGYSKNNITPTTKKYPFLSYESQGARGWVIFQIHHIDASEYN